MNAVRAHGASDKRSPIRARINIKDDFREGKKCVLVCMAYACVRCACRYARRMGVPVEQGVGTVSVKRERKHKYSLRN